MKKNKNKVAFLLLGAAVAAPAMFFSISAVTSLRPQQAETMSQAILPGFPNPDTTNPNLLLNKTATAKLDGMTSKTMSGKTSKAEENVEGARNNAAKAVDGDLNSRWATEQVHKKDGTGPKGRDSVPVDSVTLEVDLGATAVSLQAFRIRFESSNIKAFNFEYQNDSSTDWKVAATLSSAEATDYYVNLTTPIMAKKVRLNVTDWGVAAGADYNNVSVREFQAFAQKLAEPVVDPNPNLARGRVVTFNQQEMEHQASHAVDESDSTYWASRPGNRTSGNENTNFIEVTLSKPESVKAFTFLSGTNLIKKVKIELKGTDNAILTNGTITHENDFNAQKMIVTLPNAIAGVSKVRITVNDWQGNEFRLHDFGVFGNTMNLIQNVGDVLGNMTKSQITVGEDNTLKFAIPEGYRLNFQGADLEQIVAKDLKVNKPLVSKNVNIDFEIVSATDTDQKDSVSNVSIQIPGLHTQDMNKNEAPKVVPPVQEWYSTFDKDGETSKTVLGAKPTLYIVGTRNATTTNFEQIFRTQYKELTGADLEAATFVTQSSNVPTTAAGAIVFDLSSPTIPGYDADTYGMVIDTNVIVRATRIDGARLGSQTLLQMLRTQNTDFASPSIAKGQIKDYPRFKVRGISLDVANKPFSLETLRQLVRELSWYKLNQLELNLSDNTYFIEDYVVTTDGTKDVNSGFNAYSGFRLESGVENDGRKLTSSDFSYTKAQFRQFMRDAKDLGVNIVPKFNFPGHALPITKVFQDIANKEFPTTGTNTDRPLISNLDLTKKEEVMTAVKKVLDEYTAGQDAIFGSGTGVTINMGGNEYSGAVADATNNLTNYYTFINAVIQYFKEKSVPLRIVGSFDSLGMLPQGTEVPITREDRGTVEVVIANPTASDAERAFELGYKLINSSFRHEELKIVPRGNTVKTFGPGRDSINFQNLYNEWRPELFNGKRLPSGSENLLGGLLTIKADEVGTRENGLTEYDYQVRILELLPVITARTWGVGSDPYSKLNADQMAVGTAPGLNIRRTRVIPNDRKEYFNFDFKGANDVEKLFDKRGNSGSVTGLENAATGSEVTTAATDSAAAVTTEFLKLEGGRSRAKLPIGVLGFRNSLKFRIKRETAPEGQKEEVIFSAPSDYADFAIKAKQVGSEDKFGYSREGVDFTFDYTLPVGTWVNIELRNSYDGSNLYGNVRLFVDGVEKMGLVGTIHKADGTQLTRTSGTPVAITGTGTGNDRRNGRTFFLPLDSIGSQGEKENSFKGMITNISAERLDASDNPITKDAEFTRLAALPVTITTTEVSGLGDLKPANVTLAGLTATSETSAVEIVRIPGDNVNVVLRVTLTSVSAPEQKFTREYVLQPKTLITGLRAEIEKQAMTDTSETSKFTDESIEAYKAQLKTLQTEIDGLETVTQEQRTALSGRISAVGSTLVTFKDDFTAKLSAAEALGGTTNAELYEPEALTAYNLVVQSVKTDGGDGDALTRATHVELVGKLRTAETALNAKSFKTLVLERIETRLAELNPDLQPEASRTAFSTMLNTIKTEVTNSPRVTSANKTAFETRINAVVLGTFKTALKTFVDAQKTAAGDLAQYTEATRNAFNTAVANAETAISGNASLNKADHDRLMQAVQTAKTALAKPSTTPTEPEKKDGGLGTGAIAGIIIAVLLLLGSGFGLVWFMKKKQIGMFKPKVNEYDAEYEDEEAEEEADVQDKDSKE